MKKYRKYIIAVMTVLLIAVGLNACGKSTAQDLQSHQWTFASSKDNGMAATAKFSKSNLTLTQAGFSEVYTYKLIENKGNEQIKFIGKIVFQVAQKHVCLRLKSSQTNIN